MNGIIKKFFPSFYAGQNLIPSNQEAELFTFPFATTPHFVQNWSNDKLTPYRTHNFIECSLQRGQSSCYNFNKLSSIDSRPTEKQSIISRRKRSWSRAVFSSLQRKGLEKTFQEQKYITKPDRKRLAATLGLHDSQVKFCMHCCSCCCIFILCLIFLTKFKIQWN